MRRWIVVMSAALLASVAASAQAVLIEPVRLLDGRYEQYGGWQNDRYIAYSEWKKPSPNAYVLDRTTGRTIRLNARGTEGESGGIDPLGGGDRVLYMQWVDSGNGDLFFYDLGTRRRRKVPDVNSRAWEYGGRISSSFILFQRDRFVDGRWYGYLMLYDRSSGRTKSIARYPWSTTTVLVAGSVGDRYASWTRCTKKECNAFVYDDLSFRYRVRMIKHDGGHRYAPSIDEVHGNVYYVRAGDGCGSFVAIERLSLTGLTEEPTRLATLPRGIDTGWTTMTAIDTDAGALNLNFERWDCAHETGDIFTVPGVDTST